LLDTNAEDENVKCWYYTTVTPKGEKNMYLIVYIYIYIEGKHISIETIIRSFFYFFILLYLLVVNYLLMYQNTS